MRAILIKIRCVFLIVLMVFLSLTSHAESSNLQLIKAKHMLDVRSGKTLDNVSILIKDEIIQEINPQDIPKDTKIMDLGERTLMPGLIDMHVHLAITVNKQFKLGLVTEDTTIGALKAAHNAKLTLEAGYTTVRDLGVFIGTDGALPANNAIAEAIKQGLVPGPDVVSAGHCISSTGGHCDITGFAPGVRDLTYKHGVVDGVDEIVKGVRHQIKYGARVIKFMATGGVITEESGVPLTPQFSLKEMRAICNTAHREGIKCAAHAEGVEGALLALRAGVDTLEHGFALSDEAIELMKKNNVYLVPTMMAVNFSHLYMPEASLPENIQVKSKGLKQQAIHSFIKAIEAGVKVASGSDSGFSMHGNNAKELEFYVQNGMSPQQAIQTATINAGSALGAFALDNKRVGEIKPGYQANIIAVSGNPITDIKELQNVSFVMKSGVVYKNMA